MELEKHPLIGAISDRYRNNSQVISRKYKELSKIEEELKDGEISVKKYNSLERERDSIKSVILHREFINDGLFDAREIVIDYLLNENKKEISTNESEIQEEKKTN